MKQQGKTHCRNFQRRGDPRSGVAMLMAAAFGLVTMGLLGLAVDLGRMYVSKGELQSFTDAASLGAAHELDGTLGGLQAARDRVAADPNRWNFGTQTPPTVTTEFSTAADGPYEAAPGSGVNYRFVRVTAQAEVPSTFTRILPGVGPSSTVAARAVAGQKPMPFVGDGVAPFSPDAHDPADPTGNFGFLLGRTYTLRYDNLTGNKTGLPPDSYKTSIDGVDLVGCEADMSAAGFAPGETSNSQRGYIDLSNLGPLSGGGGSSLIRRTIQSAVSYAHSIQPFNYWVAPEPGEKQTILSTMAERVAGDTDPVTPRFYTQPQTAPGAPPRETMNATYRDATTYHVREPRPPYGNGRRIMTVPVNDPNNSGLVIGFAGFFLPPEPCARVRVGSHNYYPCCGEYIGPVTRTGKPAASSGGGLFEVVLLR